MQQFSPALFNWTPSLGNIYSTFDRLRANRLKVWGSAMAKPFGADDKIKCPNCGAMMHVTRRTPHSARPGHERQTIDCEQCDYSILRTVDEHGGVLR
jgi:hypothetical protein